MEPANGRQRRRRSVNPHQRACIECQKRKTRCVVSKDASPACSYCSKAGKRCTFEAPPSRTPLTRRNLDLSEHRCRQLEAALRSFRPDVDVEAALHSVADMASSDDAEDRGSDEFEWNEVSQPENRSSSREDISIRDGMASLPTQSQEAGYLGDTSGSKLLQAISSLITEDGAWSSTARQPHLRHSHERYSRSYSALNTKLSLQSATSTVVDRIVDVYFHSYHPSYPILHEHTFREKCRDRTSIAPKSNFQITFYMVLAIGHWLSSSEKEHAQAPYYQAARSLFTIQLLEAGTLGTVQALLLMGNYLQKMDRPNTGYNLIGIAYRMALGLGLHKEAPSNVNTDLLVNERRRQVFWTLYCFDSGFSITTGRPTTISDSFIDVRLPRNIHDSGLSMKSIVPGEADFPTAYSAIIFQSKIAIIANRMHLTLMSTKISNADIRPELSTIRQLIENWKTELPLYFTAQSTLDWFRAPRAVLFWKQQNLQILLWQTMAKREHSGPDRDEWRLQCSRIALETVYDITSFCRDHTELVHPGLSWYATYFLFQATLVLLLYELQTAQPSSQEIEQRTGSWSQGIAEARRYFKQIEKERSAATRCLAVLNRIQSAGPLSSSRTEIVGSSNSNGNIVTNSSYQSEGGQMANLPIIPNGFAHEQASPETAATFEEYWPTAADPSLTLFLDHNANYGFFQDFEGFPGTVENNFFDYINFNMYNTGSQF